MVKSLTFKASDAASPGISLGSEVIYFMALKVCPGAVVAVIKVTVGVVLSISVVSSLGYAAFVSSENMFSNSFLKARLNGFNICFQMHSTFC